MRTVALIVGFFALLSGIQAEGQTKTKNVFDIKDKYAPHSPVTPGVTYGARPTSEACVPDSKLDDAGEIISIPSYSGCSNEALGAMEGTLHSAILEVANRLRPFAVPGFATMTHGDAARFAAARAALAQVRALRLARGSGIQILPGSCLSVADQKDAGAVALFHGYDRCNGTQLKAMATLMSATAFRDLPHVRPSAIKDFHNFTQAGAASRFAMAKSALALILQTLKRTAPADLAQWRGQLRNTRPTAQELANPGAMTTLIHYQGLTDAEIRSARATTQTALQRSGTDLYPYAASNFFRFTEPSLTTRVALERSTLATLDIFQP